MGPGGPMHNMPPMGMAMAPAGPNRGGGGSGGGGFNSYGNGIMNGSNGNTGIISGHGGPQGRQHMEPNHVGGPGMHSMH